MGELLQGMKRTSYCAEPTKADVGKNVVLMGWADSRRNLGSLIFVRLRDRTGVMQVVFDQSELAEDVFEKAESIRSEYVLCVAGTLALRSSETINSQMATGELEVRATTLKILSKSETPPFDVGDANTQDGLRLKYRYIDLRSERMQRNLMLRHKITKVARDFYDRNGFIEIETPILQKSTPEGARDYLVPSRVHPGEFYALPQSPQLFKQLLMLSGFDKYFQIAKCFRDEDLRADRQPEFTQIDVEMSFVEEEDVMTVNEKLIAEVISSVKGLDVNLPLRRITYQDAMNRFGSDKPDTRFGLELVDISDISKDTEFSVFSTAVQAGGSVRLINAKHTADKLSRKEIDALGDIAKLYKAKGLAWITLTSDGPKSSFTKFLTQEQILEIIKRADGEENDTLFFVADANNDIVYNALGNLRLELARKFNLIDESQIDLLWVVDFPLLEWDDEEQRYAAKHHPFTSPKDEDLELLESDPASVRAKAYDIVMNGNEVGGGSIRIHDSALQEKMFGVLGFTKEQAWDKFGFLMNAFKYGPPPHGGIAFGLDRLTMLLTGEHSIRDCIAFPKVQNASCPMTEAPGEVTQKQLRELGIMLEPRKE